MKRLPILIVAMTMALTQSATAQRYRDFGYDEPTHFRIGLQGGWSYMLGKVSSSVPAEFHSHFDALKTGYSLGGNATYFFNRMIGIGATYSMFRSAHSTDIEVVDPDTYNFITGKLADDLNIQYFGPSFNMRVMSESQAVQFIPYASIGYVSYKNDAAFVTAYNVKGNTFAYALGAGLDIALHRNIALGVDVSAIFGGLDRLEITDEKGTRTLQLNDGQLESVSRIDVSGGIRFNF